MKAISLWNPWAHLVAIGQKRYETRSWSTNYRGPIAIHAAKRWNGDLEDICKVHPFRQFCWEPCHCMAFGMIVAVARLAGVNTTDEAADIMSTNMDSDRYAQELQFGDWSDGRYAWRLEDVFRLPCPVMCPGNQRIWELSKTVEDAITNQLATKFP